MPYKLLKASDDSEGTSSDSESTRNESTKNESTKNESTRKDPGSKPSESSQPAADDKTKEPAVSDAKDDPKAPPKDLFLKNEWTQVVLKALHRMLQKVESHCGVSTQLMTADDDSSDDECEGGMKGDKSVARKDSVLAAKELKDATLEAWKQLTATVPLLDTAANYMMGMYLHTQVAPDKDFVVLLTNLPPFDVVLLHFINNMHDNKAALLKYWTLPLQKKEQVLADNLRVVLKQTVLPAMRRIKKDGTHEAVEEPEDSKVRVVYLDQVHPLSNKN
jgi:hypothetical protein